MASDYWAELEFNANQVFTPGAPISEAELFSGRIDQVNKIIDTISQRGYHAVLYGERGVGKTSLSNVLLSFLHKTGGKFLLPRVNCDTTDTFTSLWKKQFDNITLTATRPGVGFTKQEVSVRRKLVESLPENLSPEDIRRILDEFSHGIILVPVFDEFDRTVNSEIPAVMADTIKSLSDYSVNATILLIGVADSVDELISEHQSIERALVQVPMPRMSNTEIAEIVAKGMGRLQMTIKDDAKSEIVGLSQGLPYVTHLLALHATKVTIKRESKELENQDVNEGMERALEQWQESIKMAYYRATKSQQPGHIFREVILACAFAENDDLGYFAAANVREPLRIITNRSYDIPNFARHLKELSGKERGGLLYRTGPKRQIRYRFNSPLMRPYIVMRGFADNLINKSDFDELLPKQTKISI